VGQARSWLARHRSTPHRLARSSSHFSIFSFDLQAQQLTTRNTIAHPTPLHTLCRFAEHLEAVAEADSEAARAVALLPVVVRYPQRQSFPVRKS
jgi:hypothetical protein